MLNPAIDRTQIIPNFSIGLTQKVQSTRVLYAGKGLNVVRTLSILNQPATCLAFIGQHDLNGYSQANPKLKIDAIPVAGSTRHNITIIDPENNTETHLREPGFIISETEWRHFEEKFTRIISACDMVLLSGSLPPGAPGDAYARLIRIARNKNAFSAVDSSGNALKHAIEATPDLIKINRRELDDWTQAVFHAKLSLENAAQKLLATGISRVIITRGKNGAQAYSKQGSWQTSFTDTIQPGINTVGCGDAFFGGLIAKLSDGKSFADAITFATACGTANTLTPGAGIVIKTDIAKCIRSINTQKQS